MSLPKPSQREHLGDSRLVLVLALTAVTLAYLLREFSVTSSLLCLLSVTSVAQAHGIWAGLAVMALCGHLLFWVVYPLNPYLVSSISTGAFVITSSIFCALQGRLPAARRREERALILVALSRELSQADSEREAWATLSKYLQEEFGAHALEVTGESNFSKTDLFWYPLPDRLGRVGLSQEPSEKPLLEAFLLYTGQTIAHLRLTQELRETELIKARERLYQALLDSLSHDLRIPLVSITGVLSSLLDDTLSGNSETRQDLLENALSEADRLRRLVENLLQMTRLEAKALKVTKKPYDMGEVVSAVLDGLAPQLSGREVQIDLPDDLPLVPQDPILIGQVLRNLLDNALKYSPSSTPLRLEARLLEQDEVEVSVLDRGRGILPGEESKLLEKFYRGHDQQIHGSGLGLSICEGLIAAHQGCFHIRPRDGGGMEASFRLPLRGAHGST